MKVSYHAVGLLLLFALPAASSSQTLTSTSVPSVDKCDVKEAGSVCFSFFADGNVRKAIDKKDGATPASGSVGFALASGRSLFSGQINIADKPDTITQAFGASLVTPGAGGSLSAGLIDFRYLPESSKSTGLGYHVYGSVSSSRWAVDTNPAGKATQTTDAAIVGVGALGTWVIGRGEVSGNPVFVALDGGLAYRQLFGDLANHESDDVKRRLYGSTRESFFGLEMGLVFQINALKAGLSYYFFDGDARGVTDGQVVAGFSIQANVFGGKLKP